MNLRGPAAIVRPNLPNKDHQNFKVLTAALDSRFGSVHQSELNRVQLRARMHHREETLPELAEDVNRLARLAYPDATTAMLQVLARNQFINSLPDEEIRLRVRQNHHSSLKKLCSVHTQCVLRTVSSLNTHTVLLTAT